MEKLIMQFMCSSLQENFNKLQPSIPHMGLQSPILATFLQPLMQCILTNQHLPTAAERSIKYTRLHRQTRIARRIVIGSLHWLSQHLHTYKNWPKFQQENLPANGESNKIDPVKLNILPTDGENSKGPILKQTSLLTYSESGKVMILKINYNHACFT